MLRRVLPIVLAGFVIMLLVLAVFSGLYLRLTRTRT